MSIKDSLPAVLTLKEAIYYSRLCRTTIWKKIKQGLLKKCPNHGRAVRITREDFLEFLGVSNQQNEEV